MWGGGFNRWRRVAVTTVALLCAAPVLPAGAESPKPDHAQDQLLASPMWERRRARALDFLRELGAPPRIVEVLEAGQSVDTETFIWAVPAADLDADGRDEVFELEITMSLTFGSGQQPIVVEEEAETILRVLSGADGKKLWQKKWDDFVIPISMPLGNDASEGVLVIGGLFYFFSTVSDSKLTFEALSGPKGRSLWNREYQTVQAGDFINSIEENVPLSIYLFNGAEGKATDILLGLGTVTYALLTPVIVASRTVVIDGRDGAEVLHPTIDVGINWYPYPAAVGDLTGDGLDDYAVTNDVGIDIGDGQEPPTVGGTLYARAGTDGSRIWSTSGLTFYDWADPVGLPNVAGGTKPDIALVTPKDPDWTAFLIYMFDGDVGLQRWVRQGEEIWSPGDVGGDGKKDLVIGTSSFDAEELRVTYTRATLTGEETQLWRRRISWKAEGLPCPRKLCFADGYTWSWAMGDAQPDAAREHLTYMNVWQEPRTNEVRSYVLDARSGRTLIRGGDELSVAGGAIDDRGDDLVATKVKPEGAEIRPIDARTGRTIWKLFFGVPQELIPRRTYAWAEGLDADSDRCSDLLVSLNLDDGSYFYAVVDGGSARVRWFKWHGATNRPRPTARTASNSAC